MKSIINSNRMAILMLLISALLSACEFSLTSDVTPPPGAEVSAEEARVKSVTFASASIDLGNGAAIFAKSCEPCHGAGGLGDGEQADDLPFAPAPIGDQEFARQRTLEDWYFQVSNGDIDRFMPPFSASLNPQERWNVIAYALSLGQNEEELQSAGLLYTELCAECHGERGDGRGIKAPELSDDPGDFSKIEEIAEISRADFFIAIREGVGDEMPAYADMSEAEIWGLTDYMQNLAFGAMIANKSPLANESPLAEAESPAESVDGSEAAGEDGSLPDSLNIGGRVEDGSSGEAMAKMDVTLHIYDNLQEVSTILQESGNSGEFLFENVAIEESQIYFVSAKVQGLSFFSEFFSADMLVESPEILVTAYESGTDTSGLKVEIINVVIEFPNEENIQIIEQLVISNLGEKAVAPSADGDAVLHYALPEGASNLLFEQGEIGDRYFRTSDGFSDIRAVLPGPSSYQILFAYQMPYRNKLDVQIALDYETVGMLVFLPQGELDLAGSKFEVAGQQQLQNGSYQSYRLADPAAAGDMVEVQIRGSHPLGVSGFSQVVGNSEFAIGLTALSITILATWQWLRKADEKAPAKRTKQSLLDAIVDLDDDFFGGGMSGRKYRKQREELKDELRRYLSRKNKR